MSLKPAWDTETLSQNSNKEKTTMPRHIACRVIEQKMRSLDFGTQTLNRPNLGSHFNTGTNLLKSWVYFSSLSISQVCKLTVKLGSGRENIWMTLTSPSCRLENPAQVVAPLETMESLSLEQRLILTSVHFFFQASVFRK